MALDLGALEGILVRDLSTIEDLPDFKTPPAGSYKLIISEIKKDEINDKTAMVVVYTVDTVLELVDSETPAEDQVIPGNKFSEAFWFNDADKVEKTIQVLKKKFAGLAEAAGTTDLLQLLNAAQGMSVQANITNRVDKNSKPPKVYCTVRDMVPAV